jgi:hypothetical protein
VAFKFAVVSRDGDIFETFESAVPNWEIGDPVIPAGNRHFRVTATVPVERVAASSTSRCTACSRSNRSRGPEGGTDNYRRPPSPPNVGESGSAVPRIPDSPRGRIEPP